MHEKNLKQQTWFYRSFFQCKNLDLRNAPLSDTKVLPKYTKIPLIIYDCKHIIGFKAISILQFFTKALYHLTLQFLLNVDSKFLQ